MSKLNLVDAFALVDEQWRPKIAATVNDHEIKVVKAQGVFPWHSHDDVDECFMCWRGVFRIEYRDHVVTLNAGELHVVPRGVEHRTAADDEAEVLIIETTGVRNTGKVDDPYFTAPTGAVLQGN